MTRKKEERRALGKGMSALVRPNQKAERPADAEQEAAWLIAHLTHARFADLAADIEGTLGVIGRLRQAMLRAAKEEAESDVRSLDATRVERMARLEQLQRMIDKEVPKEK
ncbi:MAG: hypothetical protein LBE84_09735 [Planctomycetota bacterium]|jgi:hypothetical protein|nr:hypothetical protein [Planctomycetota bacterium]